MTPPRARPGDGVGTASPRARLPHLHQLGLGEAVELPVDLAPRDVPEVAGRPLDHADDVVAAHRSVGLEEAEQRGRCGVEILVFTHHRGVVNHIAAFGRSIRAIPRAITRPIFWLVWPKGCVVVRPLPAGHPAPPARPARRCAPSRGRSCARSARPPATSAGYGSRSPPATPALTRG